MQLSQKQADVRGSSPDDIDRVIDLFLPGHASSAALWAVQEAARMAELLERQVERATSEEAARDQRDTETASKLGSPPDSLPTIRAERQRASLSKLTRDAGMSIGAQLGRQLPKVASGGTAPSDTAVQVVSAILRHWYAAAVEYQRVTDHDAIDGHLKESVLGSVPLRGVLTAAVRVLYWRAVAGALGRACASDAYPGIDLVRASAVREIDAEVRRLVTLGGPAAAEAEARLATLDRTVFAAATGRWEGDYPARPAGMSETEWAQLADVAEHFLASESLTTTNRSPRPAARPGRLTPRRHVPSPGPREELGGRCWSEPQRPSCSKVWYAPRRWRVRRSTDRRGRAGSGCPSQKGSLGATDQAVRRRQGAGKREWVGWRHGHTRRAFQPRVPPGRRAVRSLRAVGS